LKEMERRKRKGAKNNGNNKKRAEGN